MVTISVLNRKLVRDVAASGWQYFAVAIMVALGVTFFNASYATYVNLKSSYDLSYRNLNFEDFGIQFHSAPTRAAERVRRIPGVIGVEARLVEDVGLELSDQTSKKYVGRLISIPVDRTPSVDNVKLVTGRALSKINAREILIEAAFAKFHSIKPGNVVTAVWGATRIKLRVVGIVQSPEYLYVVRSKQELMAMPSTFGVMFVSQDVLGPLVGKEGTVNELRVRVNDKSRLSTIMRQASIALHTYDPDAPVAYTDQPGYQMLRQDVEGFQAYAILFPAFFLSVAFLSVYTLLMRLVHQQRPAIGLLRSLGFSSGRVVWHYLSGALLVGFLSSLGGAGIGLWFGRWVSQMYMGQLQVPYEQIIPRLPILAAGGFIGIATCGFAGLFPAFFASRIRPAEAMRPEVPSFGARSIMLDRLFPNLRLFWKIPVRNVFRQPRRTMSTIFGIVAGMALMTTAKGLLDSSETAIVDLVQGSYRYDIRLDFMRIQGSDILNRVRSWPGVVRAEGVLEMPVEMTRGNRHYSAMVSGLEDGQRLRKLVDEKGSSLNVPSDGAIFGPTLRTKLGLEIGSIVEVQLPEQMTAERSSVRQIRVVGFNDEAMGTVAYTRRKELLPLFRRDLELPPNAISGIVVSCRPENLAGIKRRMESLDNAGSVLSKSDISGMVRDMMKTMRVFVWIMESFGVFLAFAVIFNMITINVLERSSEVATLRTIGVSRNQVRWIIAFENLIVSVIGMMIGIPFGRWFLEQFWKAAQTPEQQDLFTFHIFVRPETYLFTCAAVLTVSLVSMIPSLRMMDRLDLAKATKERSAS